MARKFDAVNEQVVLVSMARNVELLEAGAGMLAEDDFIGERHKVIFAGLVGARERGFDASPKNVALFSGQREFGGLEYLEELFSREGAAATPKEFSYHLDLLRKDAARFRAAKAMREFEDILMDKTRSYEDCGRDMERVLSDYKSADSPFLQSADGLLAQWRRDFEERVAGRARIFRTTGVDAMDEVLTEGFAPGGMTIFAGRPRMGKSVLWTDLTRRVLVPSDRPKILVIPFEKGRQYYLNMLISSLSRVSLESIIKGADQLTDAELNAVRKASDWVSRRVEEGTLTVVDNPALKMLSEERWSNRRAMDEIERILAVGKYQIVFFDLMERALAGNLEPQQIFLALVRAQTWCPRYGLHQVITQQLSRKAEDPRQPGKKRPSIIDLKNSGGYEEVPDVIWLIHREKVFKPLLGKDLIEMKLGKQKIGEGGCTVVADFQPAICRVARDRILKPGEAAGKHLFATTEGEADEQR